MSERTAGTGRVVVLVLPEVNLLDLGGPVQVFDAAAHLGAGYRLEFVSDAEETMSAKGLRLAGCGGLPPTASGDLVLVPGYRLRAPQPGEPFVPDTVTRWLRTDRGVESFRRRLALAFDRAPRRRPGRLLRSRRARRVRAAPARPFRRGLETFSMT
ncbi:hypothetical protein AB0B45_41180 [Nonomuraea sp. NPDC049152]|uniref:hypothetical protein n=1 Tax=Nonomuraea sp. NPDC049152 TaxID=3154350 RepID=UPI0033F5D106